MTVGAPDHGLLAANVIALLGGALCVDEVYRDPLAR
jgi:hypothetical protein